MNPLDIAPNDHVGSVLSAIFALQLVIFSVYLALRQAREWRDKRRAAKEADAAEKDHQALRLGARFVAGKVELDDGSEYAARVEIKQLGTERKHKGNWNHSWRESERRSFALPFWIRHESGERVLVEPGSEVHLVDRLDITV